MVTQNIQPYGSEFSARVELYQDKLSKTEREISEYILTHENSIADYSVQALADITHSGVASIVRLCKALGYSGFADMKRQIQQGKILTHDIGVASQDDISQVKQKVLQFSQVSLKKCIQELDAQALAKVSHATAHAKKILVIGAGASSGVAQAVASLFTSMGLFAVSPTDALVKSRYATCLDIGDVLFALSYSGYSKDVGDAMLYAHTSGATVVLITAYKDSLLGQYADYVFYTLPRNDANHVNNSTTAMQQFAIFEIIQALIQQKDFPEIVNLRAKQSDISTLKRYDIHQKAITISRVYTKE